MGKFQLIIESTSTYQVIDLDGYRANVGIILSNREGRLLWARRIGEHAWQFPQGGIQENESPEQAMYRELREEIGLQECHVTLIGRTRDWLRYQLPRNLIRQYSKPVCIGQKQVWFMLSLRGDDSHVCLDSTDNPEFDTWRWVTYWSPLQEIVSFKRKVYEQALREFAPLMPVTGSNHSLVSENTGPGVAVSGDIHK
jgi:putative (di)nucleoside polyphosphate hydrolase